MIQVALHPVFHQTKLVRPFKYIKVLSDVHVEFGAFEVRPHEFDKDTVLVLAGDIFPVAYLTGTDYRSLNHAKHLHAFLRSIQENEYHTVIAIAGNHEFYGSEVETGLKTLRNLYAAYDIVFLENEAYPIQHASGKWFSFFGSVFWTDLKKNDPIVTWNIQKRMNDYNCIYAVKEYADGKREGVIRGEDTVEFNKKARSALAEHMMQIQMVTEAGGRPMDVIVVSHHAPDFMSVKLEYRTDEMSYGYFNTGMQDFYLDKVAIPLWIHGHTHNKVKYKMFDTVVYTNPRGYDGHEQTGFDDSEILTLEDFMSAPVV